MKVDLEPFILHTGRDPSREQYVKSATWSRLFGFGGDDVEPARSYHVRKGCDSYRLKQHYEQLHSSVKKRAQEVIIE